MSTERERFEEIGKKIKRESDGLGPPPQPPPPPPPHHHHHQYMGGSRRAHMLGPTTALGINTITPCAACKLLRRRCAQECPFSPYFSPQEPHRFASVHKVFGASNVSKMLMEVPESQRIDAANSLVYEANVRLRDPVYGCMGAISALQQQVELLEAELNCVRAEIMKYNNCRDTNINLPSPSSSSSSHITLISSGPVSTAMPPPATLLPMHTPVTSTAAHFGIDISNENHFNYFV